MKTQKPLVQSRSCFKNLIIYRVFLLSLILSGINQFVHAQLTLNAPNTSGNFIAPQSIILQPPFSTAVNGSFAAKIDQGYAPYGIASSLNFVSTWTPRNPVSTTAALKAAEGDNNIVNITTDFTDGLGRMIQRVDKQASPGSLDVIQPFEYDALGRQVKKYLPYALNSAAPGMYRPNATISEQASFYNAANTLVARSNNPISKIIYEDAPTDRMLEEGSPGDQWQLSTSGIANSGHTMKYDYSDNNNVALSNVADSRLVVLYSVAIDNSGNRTLTVGSKSYYDNSDLFVNITYGANWTSSDGKSGTHEVYMNKEGKIVLKRTFVFNKTTNSTDVLSTYFVYDDFGNLSYVLPPGANPDILSASGTINISADALNGYCYQYLYDEKQRNSARKLPGANWQYMVYNKLNEVVALQNGNQLGRNEWSIKKYDGLGRNIITGIWNAGAVYSRDALQNILDQQSVFTETRIATGNGYTNSAWPNTFTPYSITYFDDYNIPNFPSGYTYQPYAGNPSGPSNQTSGLVTLVETWPLSSQATPLWTVNYYDDRGHAIQVQRSNQLAGKDIYNNEYSFVGQITKSVRQHSASGNSLTIANRNVFDHHGRLLQHFEQIGTDPEVLMAQSAYNDLGELVNKKLHRKAGNSKFIQSMDYRYNIRGWLTSINDPSLAANATTNPDDYSTSDVDKFGVLYSFDQASIPAYNGNIGSVQWKMAAPSGSSLVPPLMKYDFRYDKINRLIESVSSTAGVKDGNFAEYLGFDKMGNIQSIGRWAKTNSGRTQIDSLNYIYTTGNQVTEIDDNSGNNTFGFSESVNGVNVRQSNEYSYDLNGNETKDLNKGISLITYNNFNLPASVTWSNGNTLTYDYDGFGNKLKKVYSTGGSVLTTNYVGGIQYEQGAIDFIDTDEGIARKSSAGNTYVYQYSLKDYLGSTLAVIQPAAASGETTADVLQLTNYYPFGLEYKSNDPALLVSYVNGEKNNYLYSGKEEQVGIDEYDYGARMYDPAIGRWNVPDPMADAPEQIHRSPYQYAWNNPVLRTDPDGKCPMCIAIAIGAVVGGTLNLVTHWHQGMSFTEGLEAFGVGALAGAVGTVTGGGSFLAEGAVVGTTALVANSFAVSAFSGASFTLVQGIGNQAAFGDAFTFTDLATGALVGGVTGVISGYVTGEFSAAMRSPALADNGSHLLQDDLKAIGEAQQQEFEQSLQDSKAAFDKDKLLYNENSYRKNFEEFTGQKPGSDIHAHHNFPNKFRVTFEQRYNINIDNPENLSWWARTPHLKASAEINKRWGDFLKTNPSKEAVFNFARGLAKQYGLIVHFTKF